MAEGVSIHFTASQVQWLRENWEQLSLKAIAAQLGCGVGTVTAHAQRLGLPSRLKGRRPWAKARQPKGSTRFDFGPIGEQWLRDHWADYSFPDIAAHYGCSLATLRKWVHSLTPALPDKRGGARVGAGRTKGSKNAKPQKAHRHTYLAPLDEGIARRLKERGIAGASTYAELFDILAERNIHPFVKAWQLTDAEHRYYVGECVGPDGVRSTGVTDYETWEEAARSAVSLTYKYLPVTLKN